MTELEKMQRAKMYIDKLSIGTNPLTDEELAPDDILNNVRLSRCLFYVSDVLRRVIENGGEIVKASKTASKLLPFSITDEQQNQIEITDEPVGITIFSKKIAAVLDDGIKPLSAVNISGWLLEQGYLAENISAGKRKKVSTTKGEHIGVFTVDGISKMGISYKKNIYNANAQRFIVQNLNQIAIDINNDS